MHTSSCESFWAPIFILPRFEYAKIMTNKSYQWIARPKTTYIDSLGRNLHTKEMLHTYQPYTQTHTHTHTHPYTWACWKVSFEWISSIFWCVIFYIKLCRVLVKLALPGIEMIGRKPMLCHNHWLNASLSKNKFSGWKRKKKESSNKIRHRLISMSTIVSFTTIHVVCRFTHIFGWLVLVRSVFTSSHS